MKTDLDETDRALLRRLQEDASTSLETLASEVSISLNTCWRRVKRLEETGVIARRVVLVAPEAVGLDVTVFVAVSAGEHSDDWLTAFARTVSSIPEIVEIYRMAGEVDYLLKIMVANVGDYDRVYKKLISGVRLKDVSATFAMERIKNTTALPV